MEHSAADRSHLQTVHDGGGRWMAGDTPLSLFGAVYLADSIWGTFGVQIKIPFFPPIIVRQYIKRYFVRGWLTGF